MPPIAQITRTELLLIALIFIPRLSPAQQEDNFPDLEAKADSRHTAAYNLVCPKMTPPVQEMLIRAELSWTDFSDKEKALMNALQNENLVSEQFARIHNIAVVDARTNHLRAVFVDYNITYPPQDTRENQEQELDKTYAACFLRMTASDQELLRSSERAWLTYRNADIAAVVATYPNPTWRNASVVYLDLVRIAQLASITKALREVPVTNIPTHALAQEMPPPPVPSDSPNPEDVKAVAEFQNDAKTVLNALLAKTDDPFFRKADTLKTAPELPAEISRQVSELDAKYVELMQKTSTEKLLEPAFNESASVELLALWLRFTQKLKAGNMVDADLQFSRFKGR